MDEEQRRILLAQRAAEADAGKWGNNGFMPNGFYTKLKSDIQEGAGKVADYAAERGYDNVSAGVNTAGSILTDALPDDRKLGVPLQGIVEVEGVEQGLKSAGKMINKSEFLRQLRAKVGNDPAKVAEGLAAFDKKVASKGMIADVNLDAAKRSAKADEALGAMQTKSSIDNVVHDASAVNKLPQANESARQGSGLMDERRAELLKRAASRNP